MTSDERTWVGPAPSQPGGRDWFDDLYQDAARIDAELPWDQGMPSPLLVQWAHRRRSRLRGRAVVVGAGYGRDAEFIASLGLDTTAFDIAPTAVHAARRRYPDTPVDYRIADLLALPDEMVAAFDLVVESLTVQSMPRAFRPTVTTAVVSLVAPGGTLLVLARATTEADAAADPRAGPPWPLTRARWRPSAARIWSRSRSRRSSRTPTSPDGARSSTGNDRLAPDRSPTARSADAGGRRLNR